VIQSILRLRLPITIFSLLLFSCSGLRYYQPGKLNGLEHINRMRANFDSISQIEISYNAQLVSRKLGQVPFKIELDWNEDDFSLMLKTPFGGELATLSCQPDVPLTEQKLDAEAGNRLNRNIARAIKRVKDPTLRNLLGQGLDALKGKDEKLDGGFSINLADERLAPLLTMIDMGRFSDFIHNSPCKREHISRWFWGALVPGENSIFHFESTDGTPLSSFVSGDTTWVIDNKSGFCQEMQIGKFSIQALDFHRVKKCWLPKRIRIVERDSARQLTLNRRRLKVETID
jgi:hypothetical protein